MADKAPQYKVRIGLLIQETRERDSYVGNYYHVRAYPVTIGPTVWEQQYRAQRIDAGKADDSYSKITDDTIRNAGDELYNGLRLDCLRINSQGRDADDPRHLYGFDVEYKDVYSVDRRRAEHMYKTLRTIEQKTEKLETKYGRPSSFGQYVARIANAITADAIVFVDTRHQAESRSHNENVHRIMSLGDGAARIDGMIRTWIDETMIKPIEHTA